MNSRGPHYLPFPTKKRIIWNIVIGKNRGYQTRIYEQEKGYFMAAIINQSTVAPWGALRSYGYERV